MAESGVAMMRAGAEKLTVLYSSELPGIVAELPSNTTLVDLELSYLIMGAEGAVALGAALESNRTLTRLKLCHDPMGDDGAASIARALGANSTLVHLDLLLCSIGPTGASSIAKALELNSSLTRLNLVHNLINSGGAASIANALNASNALTDLDLSSNSIGSDGAASIAVGLEFNSSLTRLHLSHNSIGSDGAASIAKALTANGALTQLELAYNSIGSDGAASIAAALRLTTALVHLDLSGNSIGDTGVAPIGHALTVNHSLAYLDLSYNGVATAGAQIIADGVRSNTMLRFVDLRQNPVPSVRHKGLLNAVECSLVLAIRTGNSHSEPQLANNRNLYRLATWTHRAASTHLFADCISRGGDDAGIDWPASPEPRRNCPPDGLPFSELRPIAFHVLDQLLLKLTEDGSGFSTEDPPSPAMRSLDALLLDWDLLPRVVTLAPSFRPCESVLYRWARARLPARLELRGLGLKVIPTWLAMPRVAVLDLSGNAIAHLNVAFFDAATAPAEVILDGNPLLDTVPDWCRSHDPLRTMHLASSSPGAHRNPRVTALAERLLPRSIDLRGRGIRTVPLWLAQPCIERLCLADNAIEEIAPAFLISGPASVDLRGNPIVDVGVPPELRGDYERSMNYLCDRARGETTLRHVRVVLVGPPAAGKSTMVALLGEALDGGVPSEPKSATERRQWRPSPPRVREPTVGIDLIRLKVPAIEDPGEHVLVTVLDMGGDEVYERTHALFMDSRAVFVLVCDLEKVRRDSGGISVIEHWAKHVQRCAPSALVVLVGTRAGEFRWDPEELRRRLRALRDTFLEAGGEPAHVLDVFGVDAGRRRIFSLSEAPLGESYDFVSTSLLVDVMAHACDRALGALDPTLWRRVPTSYVDLATRVAHERLTLPPLLSVAAFAQRIGLPASMAADPAQLDRALQYLDSRAEVLYSAASQFVFPNPRWLLHVVYALLWWRHHEQALDGRKPDPIAVQRRKQYLEGEADDALAIERVLDSRPELLRDLERLDTGRAALRGVVSGAVFDRLLRELLPTPDAGGRAAGGGDSGTADSDPHHGHSARRAVVTALEEHGVIVSARDSNFIVPVLSDTVSAPAVIERSRAMTWATLELAYPVPLYLPMVPSLIASNLILALSIAGSPLAAEVQLHAWDGGLALWTRGGDGGGGGDNDELGTLDSCAEPRLLAIATRTEEPAFGPGFGIVNVVVSHSLCSALDGASAVHACVEFSLRPFQARIDAAEGIASEPRASGGRRLNGSAKCVLCGHVWPRIADFAERADTGCPGGTSLGCRIPLPSWATARPNAGDPLGSSSSSSSSSLSSLSSSQRRTRVPEPPTPPPADRARQLHRAIRHHGNTGRADPHWSGSAAFSCAESWGTLVHVAGGTLSCAVPPAIPIISVVTAIYKVAKVVCELAAVSAKSGDAGRGLAAELASCQSMLDKRLSRQLDAITDLPDDKQRTVSREYETFHDALDAAARLLHEWYGTFSRASSGGSLIAGLIWVQMWWADLPKVMAQRTGRLRDARGSFFSAVGHFTAHVH
jgi:Ran GTPase-activating protein (RanGAP) involved in mRNA processing and transport/GTPase SAR1 family protein